MPKSNLLIIHQGALGDFILTFPAIIQLYRYYKPIDVICQTQAGKLAQSLSIAKNWYPIEAAYFSSLFSDQPDPKITDILKQFEHVVLFTLSNQLEKSIKKAAANLSCRLPPKPPADRQIHVAQFIWLFGIRVKVQHKT